MTMASLCRSDCCEHCPLKGAACEGCKETNGHPCGGSCTAAECIRNEGWDGYLRHKEALIGEINALGIPGLSVTDVNLLNGAYVNLEYPLPNGGTVTLLDPGRVYWANQIERGGSERCFGLAADENLLVVCEYGCNGSDPKLLLYKDRRAVAEAGAEERLRLERPAPCHEAEVMAFRAEMLAASSDFDGCADLQSTVDYAEWMDFETRLRKLYGEGYTPSDVFLCVRSDSRVVGVIDYRHPLTEFLRQYGGSIGYSVRPTERGKGYGAKMLALLLPYCRECGEDSVLLCCDKGNEASRKTILRCGGVLENEVEDAPGLGKSGVIQRYRIGL